MTSKICCIKFDPPKNGRYHVIRSPRITQLLAPVEPFCSLCFWKTHNGHLVGKRIMSPFLSRKMFYIQISHNFTSKHLSLVLQDPSESVFWAGFNGLNTSWNGIWSTRVYTSWKPANHVSLSPRISASQHVPVNFTARGYWLIVQA